MGNKVSGSRGLLHHLREAPLSRGFLLFQAFDPLARGALDAFEIGVDFGDSRLQSIALQNEIFVESFRDPVAGLGWCIL